MFSRNGIPIAGGVGNMGDIPASDTWTIYLAADDIAKTIEAPRPRGPRSSAHRWPWPTSASRQC